MGRAVLRVGMGRVVLCVTAGSLGDRSLDEVTSSFSIIIENSYESLSLGWHIALGSVSTQSKSNMMTYSVLEIKWKYQTAFKCCYNYNNT